MSKNNYLPANPAGNQKTPWLTTLFVTVAVLGLGYFLFKSSPDSARNASQTASMDDHHGGGAIGADGDMLNSLVGKPMPDIQLADKEGKIYVSADFKGKYTVLFFNEGLMCYPACWNQIAAFGADERFNSAEIQAISVVVDSARDWQRAIAKMPQLAKATTMFDNGANASRALGMLSTNSSMHRGWLPGHTYVVVDRNGIVRYVFDDPNMANANNSLYEKIQELSKE